MQVPQPAFGLLGPLEVRLDGRLVAIGSRKQRVLLCALLATPGHVVPVDTLVALLWGDEPPASVAVTLRSVASRLRNALGAEGERVQAHDGGYVVRDGSAAIDAHAFVDLAARGRALLADDRPEAAMAVLARASALWRGRPFADIGDAGPLRPVVERLDAVRRDLVEDLAAGHLATGDPAAALALLGPHLATEPLREHARSMQILALYRSGRQTEALAAYRDLRATLRAELGVEPHPDLRRLHQQILRHDPTLAPPRRAVAHLPAALTPLVGRDGERARLRALLPTARLLTLTGVGGVGKTRLALQVAADVLGDFPDGVRLVELAPLHDPGQVPTRFAAALGVSEDALYGQRVLVVVDNCEHLVAEVASAVDRLLRTVPGSTVLATSRVPLGIGGEVLWPVPPLSLPPPDVDDPAQLAGFDAVTLFSQRARAIQAGFGVTADNAAAVAEICRRLDGLPLALELAASRLRALSSAQLAARLGDRFGLLTAGDRTAPARHQTLQATIEWSYRLLTPHEQAALRALTVFPAGFDIDAAEAVAGPDVIFPLVDKSVVTTRQRGGHMRYELLESIRTFARVQAPPAEADAARRRHLGHYARLVERERRTRTNWDSVAWCRTVTAEEPNLRVAIATALDLGDVDAALRVACGYWTHCMWGGRAEPLEWLGDALAVEPGADADLAARSEGLLALAVFTSWWELGSLARSEALYAEARRVADESGDDHCRARIRFFDAEFRSLRGDRATARAGYHDAIRIAGDDGVARWCHHSLAWLALAEGDAESAADELRHVLATGPPAELVVPHAEAALAVLCAAAGEVGEAHFFAERSVEGAARFELPGVQVMTLVRAAQAYTLCLHHTGCGEDVVRTTLTRLFDRLRQAGIRQFIAESLELAALAVERDGGTARAAHYLSAGDALRIARAEPGPWLPMLAELVDAAFARVRTALGERAFATVAAVAAGTPSRDVVADVWTYLRSGDLTR